VLKKTYKKVNGADADAADRKDNISVKNKE